MVSLARGVNSMRLLLLLTALLLLPALLTTPPTGGAAPTPRQCPAVTVSCPDTVRTGEPIEFNASVDTAAAAVKFTYDWTLSAGALVAGQGTASVRVDTTGLDGSQPVTATVEVSGLPAGCVRAASCTTGVLQMVFGCGFDEYGDIRFDDEKARLDNFAIELMNDPTAEGYLTCYGGRRGYEGEARRRCERAKDYVVTVRGLDAARVVLVDGGFREDLTVRLVIVPAGATPPAPSPTVDPGEVVVLKNRGARRPRRR